MAAALSEAGDQGGPRPVWSVRGLASLAGAGLAGPYFSGRCPLKWDVFFHFTEFLVGQFGWLVAVAATEKHDIASGDLQRRAGLAFLVYPGARAHFRRP